MPRPLVAIIHSQALQSNLALVRAIRPLAKVWAIVKANAYGHGLAQAMQGFANADGLSLVEWDAAVTLRTLGWHKPIMMLEGVFEPSDLAIAEQHQLQIVVHSDEQLAMLKSAPLSKPLDVHLKINTGMNRLGFAPERAQHVYTSLRAMAAVRNIAFLTHFANAENMQSELSVDAQFARFKQAIAGLKGEISVANSAATLMQRQITADWIRPGVMLYGASPGGGSANSFGLKPAMTLQSQITAVQNLQPGDVVGYGSTFKADKSMRIGIVACGYADGYPRHAPTGTPILVQGQATRVVGRVSMDMLTVDLSALPDAGVGSNVILWGDDLPIDDVAAAAGTIGYELMCGLTSRVRRQVQD
jgi:alanine racemase